MLLIDENPKVIFDNVKELLIIGAKNRNHAFHTPVFSNNSENNKPNSRIVVLRKFNQDTLKLNFYTDFRSPKITDLMKNYHTELIFYDFNLKIQLRIETKSSINNKNKVAKNAWEKTPLVSRKCYLTQKKPSSITSLPEDGISQHLKEKEPSKIESEKGYDNFTVVENKIISIDWLYLSSSGHRRLKIKLENYEPFYQWLIP